jgi:PIN domain nuclease of toxin-antitoxin system
LKLLLDTNVLIWILSQTSNDSIGSNAKQLIEDADAVYASSVSLLEIRIKTMIGKYISDEHLLKDIAEAGLENLSFDMTHADAITHFPTLSRHDPFDRMLIAQAQVEELVLITSDKVLLGLDDSLTTDFHK